MKLRSFYKATKQVEEERFSALERSLTGGQRTATFAYIVVLVLRVLRYRSGGISPSSLLPWNAKRFDEAKWRNTRRKDRVSSLKIFRKSGIKLDITRHSKRRCHKGNSPFIQLFSVFTQTRYVPPSELMRSFRCGYFIDIRLCYRNTGLSTS